MNFYLLETFSTIIYMLGINVPAILWAFGKGGECKSTESMSLVVGILVSFCQIPYFIRIIKLWKQAADVNEFESSLTLLSPKFFPIFIYQALFLAMFESSLMRTAGETFCFCIEFQETIFQIIGGIYGYFWIRGALFGGFRTHVSGVTRIGILLLTQLLRYVSTKLLRYAIVFKVGGDKMESCPYIAYANMFIIIIISALIAIAFACSGLGAIGFLISGPICFTLWKEDYLMRVAGWVLRKSNKDFDANEWLGSKETCAYDEPNFMLWVLPFGCWLLFYLVLAGIRHFLQRRGVIQIPESPDQTAEFFQKQYRLIEKSYDMKKLPEKVLEEKSCPICWENFIANEKVSYVEECFHIYHADCINKWIVKGSYCPLCKRRIKLKYF